MAMVSAPVINDQESIIGSITVDDVVEVIEEEREEDILKLGGVGQTDIFDDLINTFKSRFSWLLVNLLTAVAASIVIVFFSSINRKSCRISCAHAYCGINGGKCWNSNINSICKSSCYKRTYPNKRYKNSNKRNFCWRNKWNKFSL